MSSQTVFRQLLDYETFTYSYILASKGQAIIIDSVYERTERDLEIIKQLDLSLIYILDTHVHADHITAASRLRAATGAKIVIGAASKLECADILVEDGQDLSFGDVQIKAISTPGHTDACTSYLIENRVFTGDTLFVRGTGRTDFQQGSPLKMFDSIKNKLYTLPDETLVYPGHDYNGRMNSTILEEKKYNPRIPLDVSLETFTHTMNNLKLSYPKKIKESVPANLKCGDL